MIAQLAIQLRGDKLRCTAFRTSDDWYGTWIQSARDALLSDCDSHTHRNADTE